MEKFNMFCVGVVLDITGGDYDPYAGGQPLLMPLVRQLLSREDAVCDAERQLFIDEGLVRNRIFGEDRCPRTLEELTATAEASRARRNATRVAFRDAMRTFHEVRQLLVATDI